MEVRTMEITIKLILGIITATTPLIVGYWQWGKPKQVTQSEPVVTSLRNHPFFAQVDFWITHIAPNLSIDDKKRRRCAREFLKLKLSIFKERLMEQVIELEDGKCDICSIPSKFLDWCREYEERAISIGVPHIFIVRFAEWHEPCMQTTFTACHNLCTATMFHPTDRDKLGAMLDIMMFAFQSTMLSAETALNGLNGELSAKLDADFENRQGLWRVDT